MNTSGYAFPWPKALATELQWICLNRFNIKLKRQHAMEVIASCFDKTSASLITDDRQVAETPDIPIIIPWDYVEERLLKTAPTLSRENIEDIKEAIASIWEEECEPSTALVKRLARNIALNCEHLGGLTYGGSVLLTERDWDEAGHVASQPDFHDFMAEYLPFPSIAPFAMAKPHIEYEDRYQLEPGCILNVMAFLCPNNWDEMLARYQN